MYHVTGNGTNEDAAAEDEAAIQNISTMLLQPIIRQQDLMLELMHALDLYYTPGIIALGESFLALDSQHLDLSFHQKSKFQGGKCCISDFSF